MKENLIERRSKILEVAKERIDKLYGVKRCSYKTGDRKFT